MTVKFSCLEKSIFRKLLEIGTNRTYGICILRERGRLHKEFELMAV